MPELGPSRRLSAGGERLCLRLESAGGDPVAIAPGAGGAEPETGEAMGVEVGDELRVFAEVPPALFVGLFRATFELAISSSCLMSTRASSRFSRVVLKRCSNLIHVSCMATVIRSRYGLMFATADE